MADRGGFRVRRVGKALPPFGDDFVSIEALGGLVLLAGAVAALVWANAAIGSYEDFWRHLLKVGIGDASIDLSIQHWVNDGLMTVFFFVVGLEIKREVVRGELRDPRTVALPVLAAIGGMALPALVYTTLNAGGSGAKGWAIPAATDIAFAVGVLALLGPRVPRNLKLFVLTLAIVDDIGAIIVIALFYSGGVELLWLLAAAALVALILVLQRLGVATPFAYVVPGLVLWVCLYESGVHPTIVGVILGLLTPARPFGGRQVIESLEHGVHPWSSFLIVPLFALANAGIVIDGETVSRAFDSPVTIGIALGLVLGKTLGITLATALGVRLRLGRLPDGVRWPHLVGGAAVAGIGFTVALFVADLSFRGARLDNAIMGIIAGSLLSGFVGAAIISCSAAPEPDPGGLVNVVAYVTDLMDRTKVQSAVAGTTFARDPAAAAGADVVIVDLVRFADAVVAIRTAAPGARIIAFGPHVDDELLRRASDDGADAVMPRSQFFRDPARAVGA